MCIAHPEKQLKFTCGTYNEMNMVACGRMEHLFLPWPFHILGIYPIYPHTCIMNSVKKNDLSVCLSMHLRVLLPEQRNYPMTSHFISLALSTGEFMVNPSHLPIKVSQAIPELSVYR